jgi:YggT family protein
MTTTTSTPKDTASSVRGQSPTNVNMATAPAQDTSIWTASRVIALVFTVLEVLLLVRFTLKLLGANADQPLASAIYGITDPLVAPFRGMFAQPAGTPVVEIATLLSIVFFVLVAALVVAIVRAVTGRRGDSNP